MTLIDNRYNTIKQLKGGNMTSIYLCNDYEVVDENEDQLVAVKLFNKVLDSDSSGELRKKIFHREVESLERASHQNVVKIKGKGFDKRIGSYYIALEYFEGKTLDKALSEEFISEETKIAIVEQIFNGVEHLHRKGIVHRDLKPSNILVNHEGEVKLIDFGISKLTDTFYSEYTICNYATPKYASPEQKLGKTITEQSDIYSLGVILKEIFPNEEYLELIERMTVENIEGRYKSLHEVSSAFKKKARDFYKNKYVSLRITRTITRKLKAAGYIDEEDIVLARKCVDNDLQHTTYMSLKKENNTNVISHTILGKVFQLICTPDRLNPQKLCVVDIWFRDAAFLEMIKEQAMEIPYDVHCSIDNKTMGENEVGGDMLIDEFSAFTYEATKQKEVDLKEKNIINRWSEVLKLQRRKLEKSKGTLPYREFTVSSDGTSLAVRLSQQYPEVLFTQEDQLTMTNKYNPIKHLKVGRFKEIENNIVIIDLDRNVDVSALASSGELGIDMRLLESALKRQEKAVKALQHKETVNKNLADIIFNPEKASGKDCVLLGEEDFKSKNLDASKRRNIEKALESNDLFLLQGPPGTGKTTFISELVYQILAIKPDSKILISSQSNVAVDHSLTKIKELITDVSMIRVGMKEKFSKTVEDYTVEAFCEEWCSNVITRCKSHLEAFKQKINIDHSISETYNILLEITEVQSKLDVVTQTIESLKKEKGSIEVMYNKTKDTLKKLNAFAASLGERKMQMEDTELATIVEQFQEDFLGVGAQFMADLEAAYAVSAKKEEVEEILGAQLQEKIQLDDELSLWMSEAKVNNLEDVPKLQRELSSKVKENEANYKQLSKIESICKEWCEKVQTGNMLLKECLEDVTIVGATCLGVTNLSIKTNLQFDWVIIDEAGRATPPEILVPMGMGEKILLVGDHKQLPPVIDETLETSDIKNLELKKEDLQVSLFEYLEKSLSDDCKGILNEQYRMHPAIGGLISKLFYENDLVSKSPAESKTFKTTEWDERAVVWISTSNKAEREEQIIASEGYSTYRNEFEAATIFKQLLSLEEDAKKQGVSKEVGIITGYHAQRNLLVNMYEQSYKDSFNHLKIEINTIDAFQGRETDIIFYSIVRSNKKGKIGFLKDTRRLNVALSRAKELLVLVGDKSAVTQNINVGVGTETNPFIGVLEYIRDNENTCLITEVE